MKANFIVNGEVKLVLMPENDTEEKMLKQLTGQENSVTEIRSTMQILSKTVPVGSVIIEKAIPMKEKEKGKKDELTVTDDASAQKVG